MIDPRAELSETYAAMSDDELIERWSGGTLTEIAMEVARAEFFRRGIVAPEVAPSDDDAESATGEAVAFVTVARSLIPTELDILRARLEADGIPSFVVDDNITRMNSLWSVALGGARLIVARQFAAEARQIIGYVRSGKFALGAGEDVD